MKKLFVGIDFSKLKFDATVIKADGIVEEAPRVYDSFENSVKGFRKFLKWVKENAQGVDCRDWLFCGEDTGLYSINLSKHLYGKGLDMWLEDAYRIKHSLGIQRVKSDKADSSCIAEYAKKNQDKVKLYKPLGEALERLREAFLFRHSLVRERTKLSGRMNEKKDVLAASKSLSFVNRKSRHLIRELDKAIKECDEEMLKLIESDQELKENFEIITSIKGVAMQNAACLMVYTNNFYKFDYDARKIACYYGVAPFGRESGTCLKQQPHVSYLANKMLKSLLTQAAQCAKIHCPEIRTYYERMIKNGKKMPVAINNVKNKLLHIIVAMVRNKQKYNPDRYVQKSLVEICSVKI